MTAPAFQEAIVSVASLRERRKLGAEAVVQDCEDCERLRPSVGIGHDDSVIARSEL